MGNFVYSIRELETEVARLKIELKRADNYRVNQECEAISCKYRVLKKIEQLNTEISELESERDALKAEVGRLKVHTWEQERAAIAQYVRQSSLTLDLAQIAERIVQGKHWPEVTSVVEQEQTVQETGQYPVEITWTWADGSISHARAKKAYARSDDQYPVKLEGLCVPSVPHSVSEKQLLKWLDASEEFGKQRVPRLDIRTPGRRVTCKDAWVSVYQFSVRTWQVENIEIFGAGWL